MRDVDALLHEAFSSSEPFDWFGESRSLHEAKKKRKYAPSDVCGAARVFGLLIPTLVFFT